MRITADSARVPPAVLRAAGGSLWRPRADVIRVTELVDAPMIRQLTLRHWNRLSVPVDDLVPALLGTAWHRFMDDHGPPGVLREKRLWLPAVDGIRITGQFDEYDPRSGELRDYKTLSAWKYVFRDFADWECQLNVYAELLEEYRMPVRSALVYGLVKDWSRNKALQTRGYPPGRLVRVPIRLWSRQKRQEYIRQRITVHTADPVPACNEKERWVRDSGWALMKKGRKSALRVLATEGELRHYMQQNEFKEGKTYRIEYRAGVDVRCEDWCVCRPFCPRFNPQAEINHEHNSEQAA